VLALTVACGGGGGGTTDGGGGPLGPPTAAEFCDTLYGTYAQRLADCSKAPLAWATFFIDKTKLCANLVSAVDTGLGTYDRNAAGRCLAAYEGASCTDLRGVRDQVKYYADCEAAVKGTKPNSGATFQSCLSDYECSSGYCTGAGATCPGGCYATRATGSSCSSTRQCGPGAFCYSGSLYPNNTCQPFANRPGLDQPCGSAACQPGLYCDKSAGPYAGKCAVQVSGGACPTDPKAMAPGFGCFSGVTQPLLGPGAACNLTADDCGTGLFCGAGSVCTLEPFVGEPCVYFGGKYQPCIGGYCNTVSCVREAGCGWDWDCESNGYCMYGTCEYFCAVP
jgi:hypothetical protein